MRARELVQLLMAGPCALERSTAEKLADAAAERIESQVAVSQIGSWLEGHRTAMQVAAPH